MSSIFNDESFKRIQRLAPKANATILMCPNHVCTKNYEKYTTKFESKHDWLLRLSCKVCKKEWAVCIECPKFKTIMKIERQICMHRNTYHKGNQASILQTKPNESTKEKVVVYNNISNRYTNDIEDGAVVVENNTKIDVTPVNDLVIDGIVTVETNHNMVSITSDMVINHNMVTPTLYILMYVIFIF
jgi:hypothetical protein